MTREMCSVFRPTNMQSSTCSFFFEGNRREFNMFLDPLAAKIVLESRLNITHSCCNAREDCFI
jgi:inosine-uridine nucleoside N-ribohydrolase